MRGCFLSMAARVLGDASGPAEERNARILAEWIMHTQPAVVNVSSIRDRARMPGVAGKRAGEAGVPVPARCRVAAAAGVIRGGGPRGDWPVNPQLWAKGRQRDPVVAVAPSRKPRQRRSRYGGGWAGAFALIAFLGAGVAPNEE